MVFYDKMCFLKRSFIAIKENIFYAVVYCAYLVRKVRDSREEGVTTG